MKEPYNIHVKLFQRFYNIFFRTGPTDIMKMVNYLSEKHISISLPGRLKPDVNK